MDDSPYLKRQLRLAKELEYAGLSGLVLNSGASLVYLTGLHFHLSERPVVGFFQPGKMPIIVLPELETAKIENLSYPLQAFTYSEDPETWLEVFRKGMQAAGMTEGRLGVEPTRLRFLELRLLETAAPEASFTSAETSLAALRMVKDANEIMAMRRAVEIAQKALQAAIPAIRTGISERELASALTLQLLQNGSDPEMAFSPIVSGGPNSANPHATPTSRPLQTGDLLVIDWGASFQGYLSDLTRTFAIGQVEDECERIAKVVEEANAAAFSAARPGVTVESVDRAARVVIEGAGYGHYFTHRTGHGLGMEGHEPPYIRQGNSLFLEPGMTFTIEPGIYLPNRNGVRIEDDVVITQTGCESLSDLPRQLYRIN